MDYQDGPLIQALPGCVPGETLLQGGRLHTRVAQFITLCSAYNLAEARCISCPLLGSSLAKTQTFSRPSRAHGHPLRPSTNCYKLSETFYHASSEPENRVTICGNISLDHPSGSSQPLRTRGAIPVRSCCPGRCRLAPPVPAGRRSLAETGLGTDRLAQLRSP